MNKLMFNRQEVTQVVPPPVTATWHPIAHRDLLQSMDLVVKEVGYKVSAESYSMTRGNRRLFGSWVLDVGNGANWMIGFRHGNDKSLKVGFCAGSYVMVCSNMCFSGEFFEFRMHTSRIDIPALVRRALEQLSAKMEALARWQESLKKKMLPPVAFKAISFDLLQTGIVKPVQFEQYLAGVDEERLAFTKTRASDLIPLYVVHGGVTRMLRGHHIGLQQSRTASLNRLVDQYAEAA
jgi:hypothetical protein